MSPEFAETLVDQVREEGSQAAVRALKVIPFERISNLIRIMNRP